MKTISMRLRKTRNLICLFFSGILLASCAQYGVKPTVRSFKKQVNLEVEELSSSMSVEEEFDGIESIVTDLNGQVTILMIHGVREKSERHWDFFKHRLTKELKWTQLSSKARSFGTAPSESELGPLPWRLVETTFCKKGIKHNIHLKEVFWYPLTTQLKAYINDYDASIYRTGLAAWLKKEVFLDSFVDFALYSNEAYRDLMKNTITTTFERMEANRQTVVVAGGLGGQLVIDWMEDQQNTLETFRNCIREGHTVTRIGEIISDAPDCSVKLDILAQLPWKSDKSDLVKLHNQQMPVRNRRYMIKHLFFISNHVPFTSMFTFTEEEIDDVLSIPTEYGRFASMNRMMLDGLNEFSKFLSEMPLDTISIADEHYQVKPLKDVLKVVSFFDASDPFGFYLPNAAGEGVKVTNARRQNAGVFEFDSHETIKALKSIPLVNLDGAIYSLIDENKARQKLQLRVDGAQEDARSDTLLVSAILSGVTAGPQVEIKKDLFEEEEDKFILKCPEKRPGSGFPKRISQIIAALGVTDGGLVSPFQNPSVEIENAFQGMKEQMKSRTLTQVITIHGMRSKKPNHNDDMIFFLAEELGFYLTPISDKVNYIGQADRYGDRASVRSITFQNQNNQKLIFHTIYWSPMTTALKDWLKERSSLQASTRATQLLRREIIADGLGDVAVALNGQNSMFREIALKTMHIVDSTRYQNGKSSLNFLLSGSLGSWLMYDFVKDYYVSSTPQLDEKVVYRVFEDMPEWFLFTNQINLIGFTKIGADFIASDKYEDDILFKQQEKDGTEFKTRMIGFNDPNDILSYKLPEAKSLDDQKIETTNVYLNSTGGLTLNMNNLVKYAKWIDDILLNDYTYQGDQNTVWNLKSKRSALEAKQKVIQEECQRYNGPPNMRPSVCNFISREAALNYYKEQKKRYKLKREWLEVLQQVKPEITYQEIFDSLARAGYRYELSEFRKKDHLMKKKFFKRLSTPGLVMGALRSFATGEARQDLVVDFATAHEGPDNNCVLLRLIANGPDKVNKTFRPQP